jgi:hypothetical protein
MNRNIISVGGFVFTFVSTIAAIEAPTEINEYTNLQVLPHDISSRDLQHIMVDEFQDGLGVGCGYCHVKIENSILLDYASDAKPEKQIARMMMQMTMEINSNHFFIEKPVIGDDRLPITCFTCHRGTPRPEK